MLLLAAAAVNYLPSCAQSLSQEEIQTQVRKGHALAVGILIFSGTAKRTANAHRAHLTKPPVNTRKQRRAAPIRLPLLCCNETKTRGSGRCASLFRPARQSDKKTTPGCQEEVGRANFHDPGRQHGDDFQSQEMPRGKRRAQVDFASRQDRAARTEKECSVNGPPFAIEFELNPLTPSLLVQPRVFAATLCGGIKLPDTSDAAKDTINHRVIHNKRGCRGTHTHAKNERRASQR